MTTLDAQARAGLDALVSRYRLPATAASSLSRVLAVLATDPHAPTTVTAPADAVDVHIADALVALEIPELRDARTLADLGSGSGIPALPLAIALPDAEVWAVESVARKARFIADLATAADARNVHAVPARAEEWADRRGALDIVTARALAPLGVLAEYAAPLLREGGLLVAWKGRLEPEEERAAAVAAAELGMALEETRPVVPYPAAVHRRLCLLRKVAPTPARFPRRPGMARKRPLGASAAGVSDRARR